MRKKKLYSESEAIKLTGFAANQLTEKIGSGDVKELMVNGKKYYRISSNIIKRDQK